ncbi:ribulose-phosphate 3-epimerase [Picrophilus oshimae]|uniref:Ribulose-phosphate 3-epimerase n=1 Tax=Picrophilus torridus (strain ATCC 700027 / DSM 9790 / JCM 10055 / NBRC 100828 / KAW 2/3) TaxID=1122961 RepID=Q6L0S2_PICTO|nr:ribulose-phosphate 3-epimerase [Picrophilus oshimae]AAT43430.1 ribulose-phosphate 3-epimerase [Picrophilus oshimae DSM 9789]
MVEVSPSIISSDLSHLYDEIKRCEDAGAGSFHLDVMDGHFVNNITMGPDLIKAIRKSTGLRLDAHLMIERPDKYYKSFLDAGADVLLIHYESPVNTMELLKKFHRENIRYGIVINPETNFERVKPLIENAEILLIMSVNPGFSGQKFIDDSLIKVSQAKEFIRANNLKTRIEIDGGINDETGRLAANAGADILVSASFIFKNGVINPIKTLKNF